MWTGLVLSSILNAIFLSEGIEGKNSFEIRLDVFSVGMFLIPIIVSGGMRFWISRIKSRWLLLLPYLIGLVFAQSAGLYGLFLLPEVLIVFQGLSIVLFLVYAPFIIKPMEAKTEIDSKTEILTNRI